MNHYKSLHLSQLTSQRVSLHPNAKNHQQVFVSSVRDVLIKAASEYEASASGTSPGMNLQVVAVLVAVTDFDGNLIF